MKIHLVLSILAATHAITTPLTRAHAQQAAYVAPSHVKVKSGLTAHHAGGSEGIKPAAVYNGGHEGPTKVGLRIGNGGAGQTGLIGAWADSFINYMVYYKGHEPFTVEWYLSDTTESLDYLEHKVVDVAVTYNEAAERQLMKRGFVSKRVYAFREHFYLVGPIENPAGLEEDETILEMAQKIVQVGNQQASEAPHGIATRFLSRYDKSATNIKESEIFVKIGQVPWAYDYSRWYHIYPRFPLQALEAASDLKEYTLTDRGTWLSSTSFVRDNLEVFKAGTEDPNDILLMPAHVLLGKYENLLDQEIGKAFVEWVRMYDEDMGEGGQYVVQTFTGNAGTQDEYGEEGTGGEPLYSRAPESE